MIAEILGFFCLIGILIISFYFGARIEYFSTKINHNRKMLWEIVKGLDSESQKRVNDRLEKLISKWEKELK